MDLPVRGDDSDSPDWNTVALIAVIAFFLGLLAMEALKQWLGKPPADTRSLFPGESRVATRPSAEPPPDARLDRLPRWSALRWEDRSSGRPLPPSAQRPPVRPWIPSETTGDAASDVDAMPPAIAPANFFSHGLKDDSGSGAYLATSGDLMPVNRFGGDGRPGAAARAPQPEFSAAPGARGFRSIGGRQFPGGRTLAGFRDAPSALRVAPSAASAAVRPVPAPGSALQSPFASGPSPSDAAPLLKESEAPPGDPVRGLRPGLDRPLPVGDDREVDPTPEFDVLWGAFDVARGAQTLSFKVKNAPEDATAVCFEVVEHPNAARYGFSTTHGSSSSADSCHHPKNYAPFHGNGQWRFDAASKTWRGTLPYSAAVWGAPGIIARMVFLNTNNRRAGQAGICVMDSRVDPNGCRE
ncbi:MAG: hypothetical protein HY925_11200 [Elusimicrobia bacterium]|nr:hypothetical protein [Elusimicrobiota bacterium]